MTWSKDRLRAIASERGETAAEVNGFGRLLLAHERSKGRTEEDYPRDEAGKELDALLDGQVSPLPQEAAREYAGLKQLRTYASNRALQRAVAQGAVKDRVEAVQGQVARDTMHFHPLREPERERG